MTQEQLTYKILKYFSKTKFSNFYVKELIPNKFNCKYVFDLDVPEYNYYSSSKEIFLDFNTKTGSWQVSKCNYNSGQSYVKHGELNWNDNIPKICSELIKKITSNIEYDFLRTEEERTKKVRALRVKCLVKQALDAIDDMVVQ